MTTRKKATDEADEKAADADEQPGGTPYIAQVETPSDDPEPEPQVEEPVVKLPKGSVRLVFRGPADLYEFGEHKFRPGEPVVVPSETAEELLTTPNTLFEIEEDSADAGSR